MVNIFNFWRRQINLSDNKVSKSKVTFKDTEINDIEFAIESILFDGDGISEKTVLSKPIFSIFLFYKKQFIKSYFEDLKGERDIFKLFYNALDIC